MQNMGNHAGSYIQVSEKDLTDFADDLKMQFEYWSTKILEQLDDAIVGCKVDSNTFFSNLKRMYEFLPTRCKLSESSRALGRTLIGQHEEAKEA